FRSIPAAIFIRLLQSALPAGYLYIPEAMLQWSYEIPDESDQEQVRLRELIQIFCPVISDAEYVTDPGVQFPDQKTGCLYPKCEAPIVPAGFDPGDAQYCVCCLIR